MILRSLAFLGRHGAGLLASGLFIGLAAPPLAHAIWPLLPALVFLLTAATMLRIDWPQVFAHARRPGRIALAVVWALMVSPVLIAAAARGLGLPDGLAEALVLWAASPPLMSLPAIAILMGLDAALALLVMVTATFLMPLTLPPLLLGLMGLKVGISIGALMARLTVFIVGAAAVAGLLRWLLGPERLARRATEIGGLNVLLLVLFAVGVMDGMWARLSEGPFAVLEYAMCALGVSIALQALSALSFGWLGRSSALTMGLVAGNKNMAVVWANLGAAAATSPDLMLFFACAQLPIYLLPAALAPIYRRLGATLPRAVPAD
jgi:bile acid:Na+ symporter, BASS family